MGEYLRRVFSLRSFTGLRVVVVGSFREIVEKSKDVLIGFYVFGVMILGIWSLSIKSLGRR